MAKDGYKHHSLKEKTTIGHMLTIHYAREDGIIMLKRLKKNIM